MHDELWLNILVLKFSQNQVLESTHLIEGDCKCYLFPFHFNLGGGILIFWKFFT